VTDEYNLKAAIEHYDHPNYSRLPEGTNQDATLRYAGPGITLLDAQCGSPPGLAVESTNNNIMARPVE